jgi:hypothetical protein
MVVLVWWVRWLEPGERVGSVQEVGQPETSAGKLAGLVVAGADPGLDTADVGLPVSGEVFTGA